jgi:hypothetical protein
MRLQLDTAVAGRKYKFCKRNAIADISLLPEEWQESRAGSRYHTCSTMHIKGKSNCSDAVCTGMFVLIPLSKNGPTNLCQTTVPYWMISYCSKTL